MKKKRHERPQREVERAMRKPPRKVKATKDGGLILDDYDAAEPFLSPPTPQSAVKRVA
ncbi:MAG: hypothetical protein ACRERD_24105 [Candidatus Binatia bacterium]